MPVIGVNIKKVIGERLKNLDSPVEIRNNTDIKDVRELDMAAFNRKALNVGFEFRTEYLKGKDRYGEIKISGDVLFIDPDKQDKIIDEWKKTKKLPNIMNIEILNSILRKCVIKSMALTEDLQLPPPIGLPYASEKMPVKKK